MDLIPIVDAIADVSARLSKLTERHRDALARKDQDAINLLQVKISLLMELRDELMAEPTAQPPGFTGRPVH